MRTTLLQLEQLEDRTLLAPVSWLGGSGDWNNGANWSNGVGPGPDDDTTIDVTPMSGFPPMEKSEAAAALVEKAQGIAAALGFDLKDAATGGASDANPIAGLGVPTLDGLGPIGGADHSPDEWLDLSSVVPRMAMLAALIASRP